MSFLWGPSWSYSSLPDLSGKVAIVTGGSTGLGKVTCLELARHNATVYVVGRTPQKTQDAIDAIIRETGNKNVHFLKCDLMSLADVRACAETFLSKNVPLHILVNNAGIMAVPTIELSTDGIESQFATNHFAHFLLTSLLLPKLIESAPSRIVNVASHGHVFARNGIDFENLNNQEAYRPWVRYGETKLANILFSKELSRQLQERGIHNVFVNTCHPGSVRTELARNTSMVNAFTRPLLEWIIAPIFLRTPEDGARTQTFLAADPSIEKDGVHGQYYVPTCAKATPSAQGQDMAQAARLWTWTEGILREKGFL